MDSQGTADIRYRGEFREWACTLLVRYNANVITPAQLANLFEHAGFSVGVGEWRTEKDGNSGMFELDVIAEIRRIEERCGGICPPSEYVAAATPPDAPLHPGQRRSSHVAAVMISRVASRPAQTSPSVSVRVAQADGSMLRGYAPMSHVVASEDLRAQAVRQLFTRITGEVQNHIELHPRKLKTLLTMLEMMEAEILADIKAEPARLDAPWVRADVAYGSSRTRALRRTGLSPDA